MDLFEVSDVYLPELFRALDLIGIMLNGVLGGAVAREYKMDIVGFGSLAIVSALGGGMLRDMLLQVGPPFALSDPWYIPTAVVASAVAWMIPIGGRRWERYVSYILDGLVIGVWAATGTVKTLASGYSWPPALVLGVMTAVGGSMLRDIMVGRVPAIFGGDHLYATPALLASVVALGFFHLGLSNLGMIVAAIIGLGFFLLARWRNWQLPQGGLTVIRLRDDA
ncbi:MAG TPA: trimeric intracellular cation channel family protein [Actinomycetaceae bacterium]|nr:trimeric intracellular cation channel family protein [Actinomycetaceae bacterium]